jgi:hypothetical protein
MPTDTTSPATETQQCPHCKSPNPAGAVRCNCGWVFQGGFLGPSASARAADIPVPEDPHRGAIGFARVVGPFLGAIVLSGVLRELGLESRALRVLVLGGLITLFFALFGRPSRR